MNEDLQLLAPLQGLEPVEVMRLRDVDALSEVLVLQALHSDENAFSAVLFNRSGQPPPRRTAKRVELTISPNKNMHSAPTGSFAMTFSKFARG